MLVGEGEPVTITLSIGVAVAGPVGTHAGSAAAGGATDRGGRCGAVRIEGRGPQSRHRGAYRRGVSRYRPRACRSSSRNSGVPATAMMAPTGNWRGAATVRAIRSASASSVPPSSAAAAGATMR